jgi:hypothetical protein
MALECVSTVFEDDVYEDLLFQNEVGDGRNSFGRKPPGSGYSFPRVELATPDISGVRKVSLLATFRWSVPPTAMKALSLDPESSHTVSRFPGFSLGLSQNCISAAWTLKHVNHPMNAKDEQRVITKFLSNEGAVATKMHHRLLRSHVARSLSHV